MHFRSGGANLVSHRVCKYLGRIFRPRNGMLGRARLLPVDVNWARCLVRFQNVFYVSTDAKRAPLPEKFSVAFVKVFRNMAEAMPKCSLQIYPHVKCDQSRYGCRFLI